MLRYKTYRTWFSCLLRHLARKWSRSILTTPEPSRGSREASLTWINLQKKTGWLNRN